MINTFQGGEGTFTSTRVTLARIDHVVAPCRYATSTGPMSGLGKNQNPGAVCEGHPQARPLSSDSSPPRVPKKRKNEGRGSMVRRGHQRVLDGWM